MQRRRLRDFFPRVRELLQPDDAAGVGLGWQILKCHIPLLRTKAPSDEFCPWECSTAQQPLCLHEKRAQNALLCPWKSSKCYSKNKTRDRKCSNMLQGGLLFLPSFPFLLILILPKEPHYWKQQHLWLKLPTCLGNVFQQVPVTNPCAYPMVNVIFYFAKRICCIVKVRMAHCIVEE